MRRRGQISPPQGKGAGYGSGQEGQGRGKDHQRQDQEACWQGHRQRSAEGQGNNRRGNRETEAQRAESQGCRETLTSLPRLFRLDLEQDERPVSGGAAPLFVNPNISSRRPHYQLSGALLVSVAPGAAASRLAEDLEVPRPLRLLLTAGWSLTESIGLPAAAYLAAAGLDGRDTGLIAGLAAIWLTAIIRKAVTRSVPGLLVISAVVLMVQTAVVLATGELWLFLLQFPLANLCMCVLFARTASGPRPLIAQLAAEVVALRQPATCHPGLHRFFQGATWLWAGIFLLLTASLAVLMVTEPASLFLMLSTAATIALVVAGTAASALWFRSVLRKLGLRLRFAPA